MAKSSNILEGKLINSIAGLLTQADISLSFAERFALIKHPPYNLISSEYEFLRIAGANNGFSQSINLLYTILIGDEKCEYTLPDDGNLDLKKIKENSSFLKKIRNQSVDHKHLAIEEPTWGLNNTVSNTYISKTREILEEVKLYLLHEYKSGINQVTKKNILDGFESIIRLSNLTTNP